MNTTDTVALGAWLSELRGKKGYSLSGLAEAAGLAKSNLSRIERGQANPTLDTLWRLARALDLPFGTLVAPVIGTLIEQGIEVQLIAQNTTDAPMDLYLMRLPAGAIRTSEPHPAGTRERVTVINGALVTGPLNAPVSLAAGGTHAFDAGQAHHYRARVESEALVEIHYVPRAST
ncbi:helix-turn-helix domain-containing protein [Larsenimonas salina]|uniref:helix-turn-helix domain-containing protein n=1 Tax=Larsenimonas salina TaxID=1295565 RepID=UPI002073C74A|nr:XRE family transcriptional regulator [Larsenimonas salina]MCM5704583.1 XRE family transcriptional regulator [Larsenimonas salina]